MVKVLGLCDAEKFTMDDVPFHEEECFIRCGSDDFTFVQVNLF